MKILLVPAVVVGGRGGGRGGGGGGHLLGAGRANYGGDLARAGGAGGKISLAATSGIPPSVPPDS